jgi:hypothetical protein
MWFIFDAVSPARRFKRGVMYSDDAEFVDYNPRSPGDFTETDCEPVGWMPVKPPLHLCVHTRCTFPPAFARSDDRIMQEEIQV